MGNKTRKILTIAFALLLVLTLAFIWSNSMKSIPESQGESQGVLDLIAPFLEFFVGENHVTDHLVRKLAHFTEFGALGFELAVLLVLRRRVGFQPVINCLFVSLLVAVTDETIQIFYDRGSQVQDVLLDFSGAACGILFVVVIFSLSSLFRRKHR